MGSTNKTTGYELPQWVGTDKPTFLGDLNDAFLKIDNGMTANKGDASSAVATAGAAKQTADNATTKVTELTQTVAGLTDSVEASDAKADSATATAGQALQVANGQASIINAHTNSINALNASVGSIEQTIGGNVWTNGVLSSINSGATLQGGFVSYNPYLKLLNISANVLGNNLVNPTAGTSLLKITNLSLPNSTTRTINAMFDIRKTDASFVSVAGTISPDGTIAFGENVTGTISLLGIQCMLTTNNWS